VHVDGVVYVKESWASSELLEVCLSESLLDDDVDDVLAY